MFCRLTIIIPWLIAHNPAALSISGLGLDTIILKMAFECYSPSFMQSFPLPTGKLCMIQGE